VIRCEDWRSADAETIAALFRVERERWRDDLHWDADRSMKLLEQGRSSGRACGWLARNDEDEVVGWTFYLLHNRILQIGGLHAETGEVTRTLLDAILHSAEAELATQLLCYTYPSSAALESALTRRRFDICRYLYLTKPLTGASAPEPAAFLPVPSDFLDETPLDTTPPDTTPLRSGLRIAHWREEDGVATVRVMSRAFAGVPSARCFAPRGQLDEWAHYLAQVVTMSMCGPFLREASLTAWDGGMLRAAALLTSVDPSTAHVAQIVVDPDAQRRGVARDLLGTACAIARARGFERVTLLVAENNARARTLYQTLGFTGGEHFVYASRPAVTRMRGQVRRPVGVA